MSFLVIACVIFLLFGACYRRWLVKSLCLLVNRYFDWKKNKVPFITRTGSLSALLCHEFHWMYFKESRFNFYKSLYDQLKPHSYGGFFANLFSLKLLIRDPRLIEAVSIKQFQCFSRRVRSTYLKNDHLTHSIFNLDGDEWKKTREAFSRAFSTSHHEKIFPLIMACTRELNDLITRELKYIDGTVDATRISRLYVIEVMACCVFGQEPSICRNPGKSMFLRMSKHLRHSNSSRFKFFDILTAVCPDLRHVFGGLLTDKKASQYFRNLISNTIEMKKQNNKLAQEKRHDFLQIFMNFMDADEEQPNDNFNWDLKTTEAHCIVFILGGFTATSATLTFLLYEIAKNPHIQEKLLQEICQGGDSLRYENIRNYTYLDMVVSETLRKYSPFAVNLRIANESCVLGDTNLRIDKGMHVIIPVSGIHHDPAFYPDPEKFDPERFRHRQKVQRSKCTFIPFGEGPRKCIGQRFALLIVKAVIVNILRTFQVSAAQDYHVSSSDFVPKKFTTSVEKVHLQFAKRRIE